MHEVDAKGILSAKGGMNLYRGCTHGCIYCDSRSKCYRMDHDFEDVEVKRNGPALLDLELRRRRKRCMIATGAMCDPYLPLERDLQLTRQCLESIDRHGFGVTVLTKSDLVLRDLDLLQSINAKSKAVVQMTLTTLDEDLCRKVEPGVCTTARRIEVLNICRDAGIPTAVWLSPILPFLNDTQENILGLLELCAAAEVRGVLCFGMGVTMREGNREYFYEQLDLHFPGLKERYMETFGTHYVCNSPNHDGLMRLLHRFCAEHGMLHEVEQVFSWLEEFEDKYAGEQLRLF